MEKEVERKRLWLGSPIPLYAADTDASHLGGRYCIETARRQAPVP